MEACLNINAKALRFSVENERKVLKAMLFGFVYRLFGDIFEHEMEMNHQSLLEYYAMDSRIMQLLIQGIVDTGEYTLEGIAYHTDIPLDVIYDAASGINNQITAAPWARVADLYMQVKPEIAYVLTDRLLELKNKNVEAFSQLLKER